MDPDSNSGGVSTTPRELTGQLPRRTRASSFGIATAIMATVFLVTAVAFDLWAGIYAAQQMLNSAALRREGSEAVGEVKRLWLSGRSNKHRVSYVFTTKGISLTGESTAPKQIWYSLRESSSLPIRFLPASPAVNHPAAWEESALSAWALLVIPIVPAAVGIVLLMQLRGQRQLAAEGLPAAGVITKCSRGSKGGWWVEYQFRTEDGRTVKGGGWPENRPGNRCDYLCPLSSAESPAEPTLPDVLLPRGPMISRSTLA
jgi:hypothetical protein